MISTSIGMDSGNIRSMMAGQIGLIPPARCNRMTKKGRGKGCFGKSRYNRSRKAVNYADHLKCKGEL